MRAADSTRGDGTARYVRLALDAAGVLAVSWAASRWKLNLGWLAVAGVAVMWLAGRVTSMLTRQPQREHPLIVLAQLALLAWAAWWLHAHGTRLAGWAGD